MHFYSIFTQKQCTFAEKFIEYSNLVRDYKVQIAIWRHQKGGKPCADDNQTSISPKYKIDFEKNKAYYQQHHMDAPKCLCFTHRIGPYFTNTALFGF